MHEVKSVVIVGAGSAGWLCALALDTYCPFLKIGLVKPRKNAPIGVGESTQGDFVQLLRAARVDVQDFYRNCEATAKCGIFYRNWNTPGDHYWHPFSDLALTGSYTAAHYYQQMIQQDPAHYTYEGYYGAVHTSYDTCVKRNLVAPEAAVAFHVDALKITHYFEKFLSRVEVVEADDVQAICTEGKVEGLLLDGARRLDADLFVDCTGFARAIHGKVAKPDFMPYEANVNRAVVAQLPIVDPAERTPYTKAHAHECGWTWSIPLQHRIGTGYVYHGDFCSPEQAELNFRHYWGEQRMRDIEVKHINFDVPSLRNPWESNVVAVGLSAGFVEPLEATGLNWSITSATQLAQTIRVRYFDQDSSLKFNLNMLGYVQDVQDFVDAHYKLSARTDSEFWQYQKRRSFPARLDLRLALYREEMPNDANRLKTSPWAFNEISWLDILGGYGFGYDRLHIHPAQTAMARKQLAEIASIPRRGIDTALFTP